MLDKTTPDVFERFAKAVQSAPEVLECHMVAGGFDYLVKARVADMTAYRRFLGETPAGAAGREGDADLRRDGRGQARCAAAGRLIRNSPRQPGYWHHEPSTLILADDERRRSTDRQHDRTRAGFARLLAALLVTVWRAFPLEAAELSREVAALYSSVSIYPPSANSMTVCYGFVCRRREILDFSPGDRSALTQIMAGGRGSAAAERAAVQKAVIWFDRRMGPIIGTNKRVAKADFRYFDDKHNYDCWDTTRNTTSLLLVLQEWNLLKYHVVGDPHYRGNTLVLQTPHNTAVLVDRATKVEWVVDLWPRGYLQPPDVMPVTKWVTED